MTSKKAIHRTEAQWQAVISQQANSGLSVKNFCEDNDVTLRGFYAARKRLADRPSEQAAIITPRDQPHFVELKQTQSSLNLSPETGEHWAVELQIGDNIVLRVRH